MGVNIMMVTVLEVLKFFSFEIIIESQEVIKIVY